MYVYQIKFCNAAKNGTGVLSLRRDKKGLKKWQILNSPDAGRDSELLKLLALACSGCVEYVYHLPRDLQKLLKEQKQSLQLELIWVEHRARKGIVVSPRKQSGLLITPRGRGKRLFKKDIGHPLQVAYSSFSKWSPPAKHPIFAYGTSLTSHKGSDDFDPNRFRLKSSSENPFNFKRVQSQSPAIRTLL